MAPATGTAPQSFDACDRFFAVHELVTMFLNQADALVLINCMRVCRLWKLIIKDIPTLQQDLFLEPTEESISDDELHQFTLNPVLTRLFAPVLASSSSSTPRLFHSKCCTYNDVYRISWARDGTNFRSPARQAFAKEGAWWRDMLVSQPPISRVDWWHYWHTSQDPSSPPDIGGVKGWGHQGHENVHVTVGMLYDLVESRLVRGCTSQVFYFPHGCEAEKEPDSADEKFAWTREVSQDGRFKPMQPRVKIVTHQIWKDGAPSRRQGFDFATGKWKMMTESRALRVIKDGDGFNILRDECRVDLKDESFRWSRSDDFQWAELWGEEF